MNDRGDWHWRVATDAPMVHALLEASDRRSATAEAPPPQRNPARTAALVEAGAVQLLTIDGQAAAMITLVTYPPFEMDGLAYPPAEAPLYMQRLSVDGWAADRFGALPGLATLRRALEVAEARGADALRSEINPDLVDVRDMLHALGFSQVDERPGNPARAYMEFRFG